MKKSEAWRRRTPRCSVHNTTNRATLKLCSLCTSNNIYTFFYSVRNFHKKIFPQNVGVPIDTPCTHTALPLATRSIVINLVPLRLVQGETYSLEGKTVRYNPWKCTVEILNHIGHLGPLKSYWPILHGNWYSPSTAFGLRTKNFGLHFETHYHRQGPRRFSKAWMPFMGRSTLR